MQACFKSVLLHHTCALGVTQQSLADGAYECFVDTNLLVLAE